eukprot:6494238-Lingulodinium_polyedra.AAC.1
MGGCARANGGSAHRTAESPHESRPRAGRTAALPTPAGWAGLGGGGKHAFARQRGLVCFTHGRPS